MYIPNKNYEIVLTIAICVIPLSMLFFSHVPTLMVILKKIFGVQH